MRELISEMTDEIPDTLVHTPVTEVGPMGGRGSGKLQYLKESRER